jgi:nucleoside-diphosphate-sugar epimerase
MPQRLVVTGASGYIGARVVERARQRGCEVVVLGSPPPGSDVTAIPWRLGEVPRLTAFLGATAVLHLAHDWASDRLHGTGPENANLTGAQILADTARGGGLSRFIFASTTSARPEALNAYGKIKHAIEERLQALPWSSDGRIICARIGLVYGGPERAQYGLMAKLAGLPVLPMIGLRREVQPIHVDEVCEALVTLAVDPPAGRQTVVIASPAPVTFGAWLRMLRRARHGRGMLLVPVPIALALAGCDLSRRIPFLPTIERERVLGLAGAAAMPTAGDLAALGVWLRDPFRALMQCRPARRRPIAESAALLRYVTGAPVRSPGAIIRLARAMRRDPAFRRALPGMAVRWPALLRFVEPVRPRMQHRVSRALHLAAMVAESLPDQPTRRAPWWLAVGGQLALEVIATPFRLVFGRLTA